MAREVSETEGQRAGCGNYLHSAQQVGFDTQDVQRTPKDQQQQAQTEDSSREEASRKQSWEGGSGQARDDSGLSSLHCE